MERSPAAPLAASRAAARQAESQSTRHLGRRILILYAFIVIAATAIFSLALLINWSSTQALASTDQQGMAIYQHLVALQTSTQSSTADLTAYLTTGDSAALQRYEAAVAERRATYAQLQQDTSTSAIQTTVNQLQPAWEQLDQAAANGIAAKQRDDPAAIQRWQAASSAPRLIITNQFIELATMQRNDHTATTEHTRQVHLAVMLVTLLMTAALAILGLTLTQRLIHSLTRPLESLATAAAAIGAGKLDTRIASGLSVEFDMLGNVMNTMAARLSESRYQLQLALTLAEQRNKELRVLNLTGQQIATTNRLEQLLTLVATTIGEHFGYEQVQIGLVRGDELVMVTRHGQGSEQRPEQIALSDQHPAAQVVRQGEQQRVTTEDEQQHIYQTLILPLRSKDHTVGVLSVLGSAEKLARRSAIDDERLLLALGDQLGIAIENNRLHERALSLAVVEERNRLARDLHDSVTQSLFSMTLSLEVVRLLLQRDPTAAEQQLQNLSARTKETLAEMRSLIYSLRPSELADQGLVAALKRWGERLRHEYLLPVEVTASGDIHTSLTETQERELFRIAQEALNNVVKHAQATQATVSIRATAGELIIVITDDGVGFDPDRPVRSDAFGTIGMYERAALLGGRLVIRSAPMKGTEVTISLPLEQQALVERGSAEPVFVAHNEGG